MQSQVSFISDDTFKDFLNVIRHSFSFTEIRKKKVEPVSIELPIYDDAFVVSNYNEGVITLNFKKGSKSIDILNRITFTLKNGEMYVVYPDRKPMDIPDEIHDELAELVEFIQDDNKTFKAIRKTRKAYSRRELESTEALREKMLKEFSPILKGEVSDTFIQSCERSVSEILLPTRTHLPMQLIGDGVIISRSYSNDTVFDGSIHLGNHIASFAANLGSFWFASKSLPNGFIDIRVQFTKKGTEVYVEIPYSYIDSGDRHIISTADEDTMCDQIRVSLLDLNMDEEDISDAIDFAKRFVSIHNM